MMRWLMSKQCRNLIGREICFYSASTFGVAVAALGADIIVRFMNTHH